MSHVPLAQPEVEGSAGFGASALPTVDETVLLAVADPWERARRASQLHEQLQQATATVLQVRLQAVRELVSAGKKPPAIGRHIGLSGERVRQLLAAQPRTASPEAVRS
jgi:hypothetical protein